MDPVSHSYSAQLAAIAPELARLGGEQNYIHKLPINRPSGRYVINRLSFILMLISATVPQAEVRGLVLQKSLVSRDSGFRPLG